MNAIRYGLAAILCCVFATRVFAGVGTGNPEVNPTHLPGTWWVKHDLGSMDGYQMESDGRLVLVNHYSWFGDRWSLSGDTLTWVMFAEGQEPETASYVISNLSTTSLTLLPLTANAGEKAISLYKHSGQQETDSWTGRWKGTKGAFMDVVPAPPGYRIVIVAEGKLGEYRGVSEGHRIRFTRNGRTAFISADNGTDGKKKQLSVGDGEMFHRD